MQCRNLYLAGLAVLVAAVGYYLWKSRRVLHPSMCLGVTCAPGLVCDPSTGKCGTPPNPPMMAPPRLP